MRGEGEEVGGEVGGERKERKTDKYNFTKFNCDFFGITSSICGARSGYVSTIFDRMERCTEDLTFDFAPADILVRGEKSQLVAHLFGEGRC